MIALPDNLPLIEWNDERSIPLDAAWITDSIATAAYLAGFPSWEWSSDVGFAVVDYLERKFPSSSVSPEELGDLVIKSLEAIGYAEIGAHFKLLPPRVSISLPEIARQSGYELAFFNILKERLDEASELQVRGIRLEGLRPCVKYLESSRRWAQGCQRLNDEIVVFSRTHIATQASPGTELLIQ